MRMKDISDHWELFLCCSLPIWGWAKVANIVGLWSLLKVFSVSCLFMLYSWYDREKASWSASSYSSGLDFSWQFLQPPDSHPVWINSPLSLYSSRILGATITDLSQCHQWKCVKFHKLPLSGSRLGISDEYVSVWSINITRSSQFYAFLW